jgi:hypothetical protein
MSAAVIDASKLTARSVDRWEMLAYLFRDQEWKRYSYLDDVGIEGLSDGSSQRSSGEESHANGGNLSESRDMHLEIGLD